jgi:hypothetical protein
VLAEADADTAGQLIAAADKLGISGPLVPRRSGNVARRRASAIIGRPYDIAAVAPFTAADADDNSAVYIAGPLRTGTCSFGKTPSSFPRSGASTFPMAIQSAQS